MTNGTPSKGTRKRSSTAKTSSVEPPSGGQGGKPMTEISIPGQKDTAAVGDQPAVVLDVKVTVKDAVRVGAVRGSETPVTVSAADDDVVEFRLDGGAVIFYVDAAFLLPCTASSASPTCWSTHSRGSSG
jgi:hypothetical protein